MSKQTTKLGPWDASLPRDLRYGSISQGSGPPSPTPPPDIFVDFIWNFSSSGTTPWPTATVPSTTVAAGQFLILSCNYRGGGAAAPIQTVLGGTAVVSAITALRGPNVYDGLGVSRGAVQFWQATILIGGTLSVVNALQDYLQWALILTGSGVVQQDGNAAAATSPVSVSLATPPASRVISVCSYGGNSGAGGESTATAPTGWTQVAHVGSQSPYAKYVQIFEGADQSISYDIGANAVANGGREGVLFEIAP